MHYERFVGMQWRLTQIYFVIVFGMSIFFAGGYLLGHYFDLSSNISLGIGLVSGLIVGLLASTAGMYVARGFKLRLWEAGDMARRIARGDLSARLHTDAQDELGWLEQQMNEMAIHLETAVNELKTLIEQNRRLSIEAGRGAALEERARLSRDLHDTVNQHLFALSMRIAATRVRLEHLGLDSDIIKELSGLESIAREAHSQTRDLILNLRPTTLEQQGLGPALQEYIILTAKKENWQTIIEIDQAIKVKGEVGEALFRLAQEAIHNVAKHAKAKTLRVGLSQIDEIIQLTIEDDGVGFYTEDTRKPTAIGLNAMEERMYNLKGTFEIHSVKGKGTIVQASIPITSLEEKGV